MKGKSVLSTLDAKTDPDGGGVLVRRWPLPLQKACMNFGLCNAPITFQWLMQRGLEGFCSVHIDDIFK